VFDSTSDGASRLSRSGGAGSCGGPSSSESGSGTAGKGFLTGRSPRFQAGHRRCIRQAARYLGARCVGDAAYCGGGRLPAECRRSGNRRCKVYRRRPPTDTAVIAHSLGPWPPLRALRTSSSASERDPARPERLCARERVYGFANRRPAMIPGERLDLTGRTCRS
jgi:hypothetical protein